MRYAPQWFPDSPNSPTIPVATTRAAPITTPAGAGPRRQTPWPNLTDALREVRASRGPNMPVNLAPPFDPAVHGQVSFANNDAAMNTPPPIEPKAYAAWLAARPKPRQPYQSPYPSNQQQAPLAIQWSPFHQRLQTAIQRNADQARQRSL